MKTREVPRTAPKFSRCNLFDLPQERVTAHQGVGEILFRRIAAAENLSGACNFIDFTRMPPGTTIGEHTHRGNEEEFYLILSGRGMMQQNGQEFSVTAGDFVRNPPGGTHGLRNVGEEELTMFVFEVQVA